MTPSARRSVCTASHALISLLVLSIGLPPLLAAAGAAPKKKAAAQEPGAAGPVQPDQIRSLSWRSIGPANMGGRVSEITLVPGKPAQLFVATGTGGLFKTQNGGTTFQPIFDDQPTLSIGSVAIAPSDPSILYVGTGEGNGRNSSSWGNGIYKSTDGGESFTHLGLLDSRDIPRLAIHPRNPDIVFAAVMGHLWDASKERGLYRTTDGGKTWSPYGNGLPAVRVWDIRISANGSVLRIATYGRGVWEIHPNSEPPVANGNGDFNRTGVIDFFNMASLAARMGSTPSVTNNLIYDSSVDLDANSAIDDADLNALVGKFGSTP